MVAGVEASGLQPKDLGTKRRDPPLQASRQQQAKSPDRPETDPPRKAPGIEIVDDDSDRPALLGQCNHRRLAGTQRGQEQIQGELVLDFGDVQPGTRCLMEIGGSLIPVHEDLPLDRPWHQDRRRLVLQDRETIDVARKTKGLASRIQGFIHPAHGPHPVPPPPPHRAS